MKSPAGAQIYIFDDLFTSLLRTTLFQRISLDSPFELRDWKFVSIVVVPIFVAKITILISVVSLYDGDNLSAISGNGAMASIFLIISIRGMLLLMNRNVLKRLHATLEELFPVSAEDQLEYNLPKHVNPILYRSKILNALMTYGLLVYIIKPPLKSSFDYLVRDHVYSLTYPFMDWFPIDDGQLLWYLIIYCLHIAGGVSAILVYYYEDLVFATSVTQLCMHYQFLGQSLSQLDATKEVESSKTLKNLIRYQNTLTLLQDDINMIFSNSTFFTFTVIKISLCMFVFSIVDCSSTELTNSLPHIFSISIIMISVYQRCSLGTDLYENSASLINSIYDSNWFEGRPRYRRILVIMMIRTNRPIELHASPINRICVDYFKEVIIQAYQFLMFLLNFSK